MSDKRKEQLTHVVQLWFRSLLLLLIPICGSVVGRLALVLSQFFRHRSSSTKQILHPSHVDLSSYVCDVLAVSVCHFALVPDRTRVETWTSPVALGGTQCDRT